MSQRILSQRTYGVIPMDGPRCRRMCGAGLPLGFLLIAVLNAHATSPVTRVDFDNDVIPVFTKAGCNTGACHGAAVGRGGFKLSLYGSDAPSDYQSIVQELQGRRINLADPTRSLVLLKPTEEIAHGGGYRLDPDESGATILRTWIQQGGERHVQRSLVNVEIAPSYFAADRLETSVQLSAMARFSDGTERDVTPWTVFTAEDPASVSIDPQSGSATVVRRGRHIVVARYLDQVVPVEIVVALSDHEVDLEQARRKNFVDDHILELLQTLRLPVSPVADDATYVRRVYLDLTGRLPPLEELNNFLHDQRDDKRESIVARLLESDEFTDYWAYQLAKLFRVRTQPQDDHGARAYHRWLHAQLSNGVGYDELAQTVIMAEGDTHEVGPANFYRTVSGAREQAELLSELFMGNRLRCANCHNHPLDRWTQDDYHGLAAIFAKIESGRLVKAKDSGNVIHPKTGENASMRIPGERFLDEGLDGRSELASWLTDRNNPYFAKAIVNRLWKAMMGRGLVEPADDLRDTNPATHPALLKELAEDFVAHDFRIRRTLRVIATSVAYQRSSMSVPLNASDDRFYSHAVREPLEPEVLADAISDVLGVSSAYGDEPLGTRAVTLIDSKVTSEALDVLGRCSREDTCEVSMQPTGGLPRMLHLLNGGLLNDRLGQSSGRLATRIEQGRPPLEIVAEFYQRALCRMPSEQELEYWGEQLDADEAAAGNRAVLEDFVWSLLTCQEFVTNH